MLRTSPTKRLEYLLKFPPFDRIARPIATEQEEKTEIIVSVDTVLLLPILFNSSANTTDGLCFCGTCSTDCHAFHQVGRYSDHQCTADPSSGIEQKSVGKYAGIPCLFDNFFRFLGRHGADSVLLYKRCNRPNDCNYRICDLFCDLFFRKKVERITGRIGFDRLYFL